MRGIGWPLEYWEWEKLKLDERLGSPAVQRAHQKV